MQPDRVRQVYVAQVADVLGDRPDAGSGAFPALLKRNGDDGGTHRVRDGSDYLPRTLDGDPRVVEPAAGAYVILRGERRQSRDIALP